MEILKVVFKSIKKQEFGPAYLKIGSLNCIGLKGNIIQEGSIYEN